MSPKKVKAFPTEFSSPKAILDEFLATELIYPRTGNPKRITGQFTQIKLFDFEFIRQNQGFVDTALD